MHIRILSSCASNKTIESVSALTLADVKQGSSHLEKREAELRSLQRPAAEMYAGRQHQHLMRGIRQVRRQSDRLLVNLSIVSAFYGLVHETTPVAPYECTFSDMGTADIRSWADHLQIPEDARSFLSEASDLSMVLLGNAYVQAVRFDENMTFGGPTLFFCAQSVADRLPEWSNVKKVVLSREEAKRFSQGLVWLKGWMAHQLLIRLAQGKTTVDHLMDSTTDVCDIVDEYDR